MENSNNKLKKDMGLFVATALVVGNMVGSGILMLPSTLAKVSGSGATILAWVITGMGSIFLALSFARLGSKIPKTGGPYEYSKTAFGDFVGFLNAWLYWNGSWIGNTAIIIAIGSYLAAVIPFFNNSGTNFIFCTAIIWILTYINIKGVSVAGKVQGTITVFKIGIFLFFIAVALFHFKLENMLPLFPEGKGIDTLPAAATSTLWAFVGLETASVAAGEIKNPEKNVARSTILGMIIATVIYMAITIASMGAMSQEALVSSSAPMADILAQYFGDGVSSFLNMSIVIGTIGTAIGWILSSARIAYAAGEDGIFPKVFSRVHPKYQTPHVALIISSILTNILLVLNFTQGFSKAFDLIILLATLSYLPIYAFTAISDIVVMAKEEKVIKASVILKKSIVPIIGFIYAIWTIYGSGAETVMYGFLLMMLGLPFYAYMVIKNRKEVQ